MQAVSGSQEATIQLKTACEHHPSSCIGSAAWTLLVSTCMAVGTTSAVCHQRQGAISSLQKHGLQSSPLGRRRHHSLALLPTERPTAVMSMHRHVGNIIRNECTYTLGYPTCFDAEPASRRRSRLEFEALLRPTDCAGRLVGLGMLTSNL